MAGPLLASAAPASENRRSFCRICHAACPVDVTVRGDRVLAVQGVDDDELYRCYTCIKGRQAAEQIHHPARLRTSLRRKPTGGFEPVASGVALDEIAERLTDIRERHGARAIASYTGTGGYQASAGPPSAFAWHKGLGSPSFYTSATIDQPAKATAPLRIGIWEAGYHGIADADVAMMIGCNPLVSHFAPPGGVPGANPVVALRNARRRGLKLVVVDPRRTETAVHADVHLQVRPGEDPTLLAGMIQIMLERGLIDAPFCERWVDQLGDLRTAVATFTPTYVARRCGITADHLLESTLLFAAGHRGIATTGTGPSMAPHSSLTEHLVLALNTILGRVNRAGDRIDAGCFLAAPTGMRAQVVPASDPTPGAASRVRGLRGIRGEMLAGTLAEEILTPGDGQVRALIVNGGNPVVAWPDQALTVEALRALELLVVLDYRETATTELADYVIGSRLPLERADVPHILDRWWPVPYMNYTPAVVTADGDVLAEWELFWGLACRMGTPLRYPGGEAPTERKLTDDEILDLAYARARIPLGEMRANRGVVWHDLGLVAAPAEPGARGRFTVAPPDVVRELADVRAETCSGTAMRAFDTARYPFRLVSRRLRPMVNSVGGDLPVLRAKGTTNLAHMHPEDLDELGIEPGDLVEITSTTPVA